jgi:hypothetical protein
MNPRKPDPRPGKPESPASNETFPHRTECPSEAGLANQARPGLGPREGCNDDGVKPLLGRGAKPAPHDHDPLGRDAPLPPREPREQKPDSPAHEEERDTGMSGQSSGT